MKNKRREAQLSKLAYTVDSATEVTDLSRTRLFAAIADGSLKSFRVGKRRMVSAAALQEFMEALATGEAA